MLLADEPTASPDAEAADEVIALLTSVVAERQATLVCVVHDLDLVPRLADRVIVLRRGQGGGGPACMARLRLSCGEFSRVNWSMQ